MEQVSPEPVHPILNSEFAVPATASTVYVPFAVNEYLRNGGPVVTVTRLLYEGGYDYEGAVLAVIASSGSGEKASLVKTRDGFMSF